MVRFLMLTAIAAALVGTAAFSWTGHPGIGCIFGVIALDLAMTYNGMPLFKPGRWAQFAFGAKKDDGWL